VIVQRVLLVTKGLDIGGIERIVVDLAVGLSGRGIAVEVALVNDRRDRLSPLLAEHGITIHRLGGTDRIGLRAAVRLARLAAAQRFDIVHVHGPLPTVVVRLAPKHRPIVTTSHTVWSGLRWTTRLLWSLTARRDSATIAVSAVVAESLPVRFGRRVIVLPHGVDRAAVERVLATRSVHPAGQASTTVTAITVASHRDVKNYPNLLRAIAVARAAGADLRLIAVGDGPDLERHRAIADDLGLADVVTFEPPTLDALSAIAAADFLVVASDFEGQPLVVVEALALGRPVVATAVGRVPELVNPAVGRVVAPGDPTALGQAIAEVAMNPSVRHELSVSAKQQGGSWTLVDVLLAHMAVYRAVSEGSRRL